MTADSPTTLGTIFADTFKPVIGMLHLPALPGSPGHGRAAAKARAQVLRDARALSAAGVDGLMLENFGDVPFHAGRVPATTVAQMTAIALAVREAVDVPLGINVLRNDGRSALAVAQAVGASFIRVNVLHGAVLADQGVIQGEAAALLRERVMLGATSIRIFADVQVKHAAPLADWPVAEQVADLLHRCLADALIVTGEATGRPTDPQCLAQVKHAAGSAGVLVGSGVTAESVRGLADHADGFIVGTFFKRDGQVSAPVDGERVRSLLSALGRG